MACAEYLGDGAARQRDRREPEETDRAGEGQSGRVGNGDDQDAADDDRSREVQKAQQILLPVAISQTSEQIGSPILNSAMSESAVAATILGRPWSAR